MKTRNVLVGIGLLSVGVWLINLWLYPYGQMNVWNMRNELVFLTGILAYSMMGLIMVLALRPKILEPMFDGLDKMYHLHKWAGIWAIIFAIAHYLIRESKGILLLFFEKGGKKGAGGNIDLPWFFEWLRSFKGDAKDIGEIMVWVLAAVLVITLCRKIPYHIWRYTHKLMGIIFIAIAFHTIVLSPPTFWTQPVGWLFAVITVVGVVASVISLFGWIGKKHQHLGKILNITRHENDLIEIDCELKGEWHHKAGQYAFLNHRYFSGAHPFTISSADCGNDCVRFSIKDLGDGTHRLFTHAKVGDPIRVEGPYGEFILENASSPHQVWIGGGIGCTPFTAWLEQLSREVEGKTEYHAPKVDFYYCIKNESEAHLLPRLEALCDSLPNVTLHPHLSDEMGYLTADKLPIKTGKEDVEVWFCGPVGFANALKQGLKGKGFNTEKRFHQENFAMR